MTTMPSPESMVERIGRDFQLGGHKAAAIAMVLQNAEICLVSEMEPDFVRSIFLTPIPMCRALWTTPSKSWAPTPPCW